MDAVARFPLSALTADEVEGATIEGEITHRGDETPQRLKTITAAL